MASLRRIAVALTIVAAATSMAMSEAAAQSLPRCPKPEQQAEVIKLLSVATERSRVAAEDNPLLLADVGFYETELAATKRCVPSVAAIRPVR